ncbi:glycosyltransferase family 4 protein [Pseudomonadota bacterium]
MKTYKICYGRRQYPERRNIIGKISGCSYVLSRNYYSHLYRVRNIIRKLRLYPAYLHDIENKYYNFSLNSCDILHLFNAVSFGKTPWVSTFETIIPRYKVSLSWRYTDGKKIQQDKQVRKAIKMLSSESCKRIIAISKCTAGMQEEFLSLFPDYREPILNKLTILPPPQEVVNAITLENKMSREKLYPIRFMLVGHQFFSKGGREVLQVFQQGRSENDWPIELVIVSKLSTDSYASCTTQHDVRDVKNIIEANKDWVSYYPSLLPDEVLRLMESCDVGLLPSYAETYGYSVLEFQSKACPVITTNIRSFPEINNNDVGWLIDVPKQDNGEPKYQEPGDKEIIDKESISTAISNGLYEIVGELVDNPELIGLKARNALDRILVQHSPEAYARSLVEIYSAAIT